MLLSFLIASIPVAPFTSPYFIEIPNGFPPRTIPPQIFRKVEWLDNRDSLTTSDKYKKAKYVGLTRRQGNIISLYVLERTLLRETAEQNRNSHVNLYSSVSVLRSRTKVQESVLVPILSQRKSS